MMSNTNSLSHVRQRDRDRYRLLGNMTRRPVWGRETARLAGGQTPEKEGRHEVDQLTQCVRGRV